MDRLLSALAFVVKLIFSPTRQLARLLRRRGVLKDFSSFMLWNVIHYVAAATFLFIAAFDIEIPTRISWYFFLVVLSLCTFRINELLSAFYGEVFSKKKGARHERLPISAKERIILLTFAYIEIIFQFSVAYYAVLKIEGSGAFSGLKDIFDALYLSGVTITTTGFGDVTPTLRLSRFYVVYEALIGLVFIAMALAAYLGDDDDDKPAPKNEREAAT